MLGPFILLLVGLLGFAGRALWRRELRYLMREGAAWAKAQRERHRATAAPLSDEQKRRLTPFFPAEILDRARVKRVPTIDNPPFFARYTRWGLPAPMDLRDAAGLALVDTILIADPMVRDGSVAYLSLLFHELVHLVQYDAFGTGRFFALYVGGWAEKGFRYRAIPLEDQAYALQARFEKAPDHPFSVARDLRHRFAAEMAQHAPP